jgi:hypothetical protein
MIIKSYQTGLPVHLQRLEKELQSLELSSYQVTFSIKPLQSIHELVVALDYKKETDDSEFSHPSEFCAIHNLVMHYPFEGVVSLTKSDDQLPFSAMYTFANHVLHITLDILK